MNNLKVSVVVPIYKVEKYLERCIKSLLNQTLDEIEIILVNDGSPDNSQKIIDYYAKLFPNKIVPLLKENGGLSDARNFGIPYAKGEYISFIDSDDYVDKTFLEKMYNQAIMTDSEIVICGYYTVDEITGTYNWLQKGNLDFFNCSLSDNHALLHNNAPYAWNKIYHRSLFEKNNILFPKGCIWEDIPTIYPLLACANKISKVDEPLIYYIQKRKGSITSTYSRNMLQLFQSLSLLNQRFRDLGYFEEFYDELLFINMKHILLRFKEFIKYKDYKMKFSFVKKGFNHLDHFFPYWKKNNYYFSVYDTNKPFRQLRYKSKLYWYYYIITPNFLHKIFSKIATFFRKFKKIFKKNNIIKYAYAFYSNYKDINDKIVLFESFHGTTLSDSPFYMMRDVIDRFQNLEIYFTTQEYEKHKEMIDYYGYKINLVKLGTIKYARILATSKYLINNVSFPPYFVRRNGQKYLNTWHGTPLKTLGKKMSQGMEDMSNMQRNFLQATDLLFPNDFTMAHMMEDYNLYELYTGKAIISGYPRNSIFLDKNKAKEIRKKFDLKDKEVFAYMPTWRGIQSNNAQNQLYVNEIKNILNRIDEVLSDNQVFYVNLHSLVKDYVPIKNYKHIYSFPNIDNYEFLNCVDILISDYSSVFFDFSITQKPIVLFMYDYDLYMKDRGTYIDVKDLPFEKIYTLDSLINYINGSRPIQKYNTNKDFFNQFICYDSIDSTKILNDCFFCDNYTNIQVYDYSHNKNTKHTLYIPSKVTKREDCYILNEVRTLSNPVILLMRDQFNYLLRETLTNSFNNKVSYIIVRQSVSYTILEKIILKLSDWLKFIGYNKLYRKSFDNLLPNINIDKIEYRDNPSKFLSRLVVSFNRMNKK